MYIKIYIYTSISLVVSMKTSLLISFLRFYDFTFVDMQAISPVVNMIIFFVVLVLHREVNEVLSAHWRKSIPSMFLNWRVKMCTRVAVLCFIGHLRTTGRLLLLSLRYVS